jgi:hypothetical protein
MAIDNERQPKREWTEDVVASAYVEVYDQRSLGTRAPYDPAGVAKEVQQVLDRAISEHTSLRGFRTVLHVERERRCSFCEREYEEVVLEEQGAPAPVCCDAAVRAHEEAQP